MMPFKKRGPLYVPDYDRQWVAPSSPQELRKNFKVLPGGRKALTAITFDALFENATTAIASPFSWSSGSGHTAGSVGVHSNRCLIAYAQALTSPAGLGTVTMTWAGNAMTQIGTLDVDRGGGNHTQIFLFGLHTDASITTGNQTFSFSWTAGGSVAIYDGAISLYNCDQTTGWQNFGSDTGTGTSASSVITSANGNMAVAGHFNDNASSTTLTTGTGGWTNTQFDTNAAEAYAASSSGSTTIEWTLGSSKLWANLKADIIAFGGEVGGGNLLGQGVM